MRPAVALPAFFLTFSLSFAFPQPPSSSTVDLNREPPSPQSTACGDIVNANLYDSQIFFYASDAISCLTSIPFNAAVATRFITWYNETLQFHASTAYLKHPPPSYQQPAVDLFGGLRDIQNKIDSGYYKNQYAFEADVQYLTQQTHDGHLTLWAGAMFEFSFASPFYLATVSKDGHSVPKTYVYTDLYACALGPETCAYSAIKEINGVAVDTYLTDFANQNSFGFVEPNADWNNLMFTPAEDIVQGFNAFSGGATFYPGDELALAFENGTETASRWLAIYNSPGFTGPLTTGGDFYNLFVLGLYPANYDQTLAVYLNQTNATSSGSDDDGSSEDAETTLTSWYNVTTAYPNDTITHQQYLNINSPGIITGYFLEDISTAVLSIPSFDEYGEGVGTFSSAIVDFIANATDRNASKVIIDLQQNTGGQVSLAFDVMRQFFPNTVPFAGSRRRSFETANILGDATTRYFQSFHDNSSDPDYLDTLSSEWVATVLLNAETDENFTSWAQLYGLGAEYGGDHYSLTERYNLSSFLYDSFALDIEFPDCYYDNSCGDVESWEAKDITILTDGLCTSACALFVEMMTQDAKVHTVVVGGRPEPGPMQVASGSRGAAAYDRYYVDYDIQFAASINTTANTTLPQDLDSGMSVTSASFTLRDQIRKDVTTPLQFLYQPADCRLYWSFANFHNYAQLWRDVHKGIYTDSSICVPGSTDVKTPPKVNATHSSRDLLKRDESTGSHSLGAFISHGLSASIDLETIDTSPVRGIFDSLTSPTPGKPLTFCDKDGKADQSVCHDGTKCREVDFKCTVSKNCPRGKKCTTVFGTVKTFVCQPTCLTGFHSNGNCGVFTCHPTSDANSNKNNAKTGPDADYNAQQGFCEPNTGNGGSTCAALQDKNLQQRIASSP